MDGRFGSVLVTFVDIGQKTGERVDGGARTWTLDLETASGSSSEVAREGAFIESKRILRSRGMGWRYAGLMELWLKVYGQV